LASTYVVTKSFSRAGELDRRGRDKWDVKRMYEIRCSNAAQCDASGDRENRARKLTEKVISGRET
jgi:hypothetical protein